MSGDESELEAAGLLDGVDDPRARESRLALLRQLRDAGVPLEELREAVAEDRLALLPVERELSREGRYTASEIAELAGVPPELLAARRRTSGLPLPRADERAFSEEDLRAARAVRRYLDAGRSEEALLDSLRVMSEAASRVAATVRGVVAGELLRPGDSERVGGLRLALAARELAPEAEETLVYLFREHLREQLRSDVLSSVDLYEGPIADTQEVTVCFADLVGFTRMGAEVGAHELGGIAGRLAALAGDVARPPVRLVKTIGDAAMFVSPDTDALLHAALDLVENAEAAVEEGFPPLRAGADSGEAVQRWGDWYGAPVNVASRVTDLARPGSVLVTQAVRDRARDGFRWSFAKRRKLKGVPGEVALHRCRRG